MSRFNPPIIFPYRAIIKIKTLMTKNNEEFYKVKEINIPINIRFRKSGHVILTILEEDKFDFKQSNIYLYNKDKLIMHNKIIPMEIISKGKYLNIICKIKEIKNDS